MGELARNARLKALTFVLVGLAFPVSGSGQINAPGARTLFARTFLVRSDWRLSETAFVDSGRRKANRTMVWENTVVYGFGHSLMGIATLPIVNRPDVSTSDATASRGTALGDPTFLVQFDGLYRNNRPGGFTRLATFFGVRPPWGRESFTSGAYDLVQGLIWTRTTPRWWTSADIQWTATTDRDGLKRSDALQLDASVMYRARTFPQTQDLFLVLELNAIRRAQDIADDQAIESSGGGVIFLSPGAEIFVRRNLVFELSAQIPIDETFDDTRASPQWSLVAGFRFLY